MDQKRTGRFIAERRREAGLTQMELAEKLGVTDRSVSNWETGKCMPDLGLFEPLCDELGIDVNELMSGQKIEKEEYREKSSENMVATIKYTKKQLSRKDKSAGAAIMAAGLVIVLYEILSQNNDAAGFLSFAGPLLSVIGFYKLIKNLSYFPRVILMLMFFGAISAAVLLPA